MFTAVTQLSLTDNLLIKGIFKSFSYESIKLTHFRHKNILIIATEYILIGAGL